MPAGDNPPKSSMVAQKYIYNILANVEVNAWKIPSIPHTHALITWLDCCLQWGYRSRQTLLFALEAGMSPSHIPVLTPCLIIRDILHGAGYVCGWFKIPATALPCLHLKSQVCYILSLLTPLLYALVCIHSTPDMAWWYMYGSLLVTQAADPSDLSTCTYQTMMVFWRCKQLKRWDILHWSSNELMANIMSRWLVCSYVWQVVW